MGIEVETKMARDWWEIIRVRVQARAREQGRSVRSVLTDADVTPDILYRGKRGGSPKLETLEKIARVLGLSMPQIMGYDMLDRMPLDLLALAVRCIWRALPEDARSSQDEFISALQTAVTLLISVIRQGHEINTPAVEVLVVAAIDRDRANRAAALPQRTRPPRIP